MEFLSSNSLLFLDLLADGVGHVLHASRYLLGSLVPLCLSPRVLLLIKLLFLLSKTNIFTLFFKFLLETSLFLLSFSLKDPGSFFTLLLFLELFLQFVIFNLLS